MHLKGYDMWTFACTSCQVKGTRNTKTPGAQMKSCLLLTRKEPLMTVYRINKDSPMGGLLERRG